MMLGGTISVTGRTVGLIRATGLNGMEAFTGLGVCRRFRWASVVGRGFSRVMPLSSGRVCVARSGGPAATQHLRKENSLANSAFLVFLRVPGGHVPARRHLESKTGDLPAGAEVALVRRALVVAAPAKGTPTNLIESIQLRIYGATRQSVSEFRLSRRLLFAGQAGGLRAVGSNERDFKTGFGGSTWDLLEEPLRGQDLAVRQRKIMNECVACHNRDRFPGLRAREAGPLLETTVVEAMGTAVNWKRQRPDWKVLRKLLAE